MILLIHKRAETPLRVLKDGVEVNFEEKTCPKILREMAENFPDEIITWCEEDLQERLAFENWENIFHHELIMASYSVSNHSPLLPAIGYVENSPFLKINSKKTYPTWLMSTDVGGVHAKVLLLIDKGFFGISDFSYFLLSLAKLGQNNSMFCYSDPGLLKEQGTFSEISISKKKNYLFKFVRQNYRLQWSYFLLFSYIIYEKKYPFLPFILALQYKSHRNFRFNLDELKINSRKKLKFPEYLEVIIPTLGRRECVQNLLKDLKDQTLLPQRIFVIEQNPDPDSKTDLEFIEDEEWPFEIVHHLTHTIGACHARNYALKRLAGDWVFLSDDDIRLEKDFIENAFKKIDKYSSPCSTFSVVSGFDSGIKNEKTNQSTVYGSGHSIVQTSHLSRKRFSKELEYGYGEDIDFGMQIRNSGIDVVHFSHPQIKHLKAPVGGFRTDIKMSWQKSVKLVKPSPTVLWVKLKHLTREQFLGYKLFYFFNQLKNGNFNLLKIRRQWIRSREYVNKL